MQSSIKIPYQHLCEQIKNALVSSGLRHKDAQTEAELLVEADLNGVPSHGVRMLPKLLDAIRESRINPLAEITVQRSFGATCTVDCQNGPGRYTAMAAMMQAVALADQFGIGLCLAKRTSHWGRVHAYVARAAQQGYIAIATTNAIPTMAIGGAKTPVIGNNPLGIGIPQSNTQEPLVLDMAMSQAAVGKVATWLREGRHLPDNWGLDAEGQPSNDASAILNGAVLPMGEHKGAGLSVMFELLTAGLAGGLLTQCIKSYGQASAETDTSKIFIAINIEAFLSHAEFNAQVASLLDHLKSEAAPFLYPGERGWHQRNINLHQGVPLHAEIIAQLQGIGLEL